jgi:TP901 family phage tail tape measure protein
MADLGTLSVGIKADVSALERDLGKATSLIDRFGSKFKSLGSDADGIGGKLGSLAGVASGALSAGFAAAMAGAAALGAGLVALGGIAVKVGVEALQAFVPFQKQMSEVYTLLPGLSEKAMGEMSGDVLKFSKDFGVLPDKVVPALYESLSAGVPQDNVFSFLETAQKASVGGVTDLAVAVDGLTSVTNAYGADVIDAAKASDIMFQTVKIGKTTFDELSRSLFNVNPVAASLGLGFEDVGAALAAMTAQGVPTSVATTQLRQLLLELSQAGTDVSDVFLSLTGKTFQEFIAEGGNLQEALQVIEGGFTSVEDSSEKVNKITEKIADLKDQLEVATIRQGEFTSQTSMATKVASENKIADLTQEIAKLDAELATASSLTGETHTKMSDLFGSVEAGSAALILTGKGTDAFTNSLTAMEEAAGSTEAAFGTMDATISQNLERIRAAGQVLLIEIGEKLAPVFGQGVDMVLQKIPSISQAILGMVDKSLPVVQKLFGWFRETAIPWITEFATRSGEILTKFFGDFDRNFGPAVKRLEQSVNMIITAFKTATGETSVMDGIMKGLQVVLNIVALGFDVWTRNVEMTVRSITTLVSIIRTVYNAIRDVINLVPNFFGSGLFALSGGKTFQQLGLAEGGQFVVPPGFPNDSFPIGVSSGEFVSVTPAGQVNTDNRQFNMTVNTQATQENVLSSYHHAMAALS